VAEICEECGKFIEDEFDKCVDANGNVNRYFHNECHDKYLEREYGIITIEN